MWCEQMTTIRCSYTSHGFREQKRYLLLIASFLMIVIPRIIMLGSVCTVDEPQWMIRSQKFIKFVSRGYLHKTFVSKHPGVTVMWIAGIAGRSAKAVQSVCSGDSWKEAFSSSPPPLWRYRPNMKRMLLKIEQMAIALFISVFAWLSCLWFSKALNSGILLMMSSLLIGADPFYVGLCRIVNPDGLMATFAFASCGALVCFVFDGGLKSKWLFISGGLAGLCALSKVSGLILIPWALGALVVAGWMHWAGTIPAYWLRFRRSVLWGFRKWGIWFTGMLIIFVSLWPAFWVSPFRCLKFIAKGAWWAIITPHKGSTAAIYGHGPEAWDYFIRLAIFTPPWIPWILALGVMLLIFFTCISVLHKRGLFLGHNFGIFDIENHRWLFTGIALITFILSFPILMSFGSKQAGRYILASFIGIDIFTALLCTVLITTVCKSMPRFKPFVLLLVFSLILWCGATLGKWLPYTTAYRHPFFGNLPVSGKPLPYWWGEGIEESAEVLNKLEGSKNLVVATSHPQVLFMFFEGTTCTYRSVFNHSADYVVLYRDFVERHPNSKLVGKFLSKCPLIETIYLPNYRRKPITWIYDTRHLK